MRFKKALALLLTCSIIVTEVPVFAAEREDSQGKENVLAAKEDLEADSQVQDASFYRGDATATLLEP